jgi:hypothetical protein
MKSIKIIVTTIPNLFDTVYTLLQTLTYIISLNAPGNCSEMYCDPPKSLVEANMMIFGGSFLGR